MRKITGKVVSLVLALALAATSFSANFASATTRTVAGTASFDGEKSIYLVNGGSTEAARSVTAFSQWVDGTVDTADHHDGIGTAEISDISHVSGDKLVKWDIDNDTITLRSADSEGQEVISILFKATYTNDDGDDVTVKASKQFTIYAYDAGSALVRMYAAKDSGKAPDEVGSFARNDGSYKDIAVYKASNDGTSAKAVWTNLYTPVIKSGSAAQDSTATNAELAAAGVTTSNYADYQFVYSDNSRVVLTKQTGNYIRATVAANVTTTKTTKLAATGNVSVNARKVLSSVKVSTDTDDKVTAKSKIDKKIIAPAGYVNIGKDKGTYLYAATLDSDANDNIDVANSEVVFGGADGINTGATPADINVSGGTVTKISGKVDSLTITEATVNAVDLDTGDVVVSDDSAKVGNITTDDNGGAAGNTGKVTVDAGKVGNIDTTDASDGNDTVEVTGGTVGTIATDGIVTVVAGDEETPAVTGDITAKQVTLDSNSGKVSVGTIKSTAAGSTIALENGDYALSVKGFNFDYRDTALTLSEFSGKIAAPVNAQNGSISYETDSDSQILTTVTGTVNVGTINIDEYTTLAFDGAVEVGTVSGSGTLKVYAGKLYVTEGASGVKLKLADAVLSAGMTAFKADIDMVDVEDMDTFGFTLAKTAGTSIDTFKIASIYFGGIGIDKSDINVAVGQKQTFTVVAYPTGTSLPAGSQVSWDFEGNDEIFAVTYSGNTATVSVLKTDSEFASENAGTLTATLQDAEGYALDDYDAATATVNAVKTPDAVSDTNAALTVAKGAGYTMKVTSASVPSVTLGSAGVYSVALVSKNGNDYFYKLTATGDAGKATGVYLNGRKLFVATVKAFAFTSDTTTNTTVKGAYTFKVTSDTAPVVTIGSGVFKLALVSQSGKAYFYKLTSAGANGAAAGVYVNGSKIFVAKVG
ncbi:MAG TPA: hypothetical protein VHP54_07825 [Caproiciproducens sp.]|nr:hypothetical protein [Caproiciproducens sp.]